MLDEARRLGSEHGRRGDLPYVAADDERDVYEPDRYVSYVYWEAGSGGLMTELGRRDEPASDEEWNERVAATRAYCEAFAAAAGIEFCTD